MNDLPIPDQYKEQTDYLVGQMATFADEIWPIVRELGQTLSVETDEYVLNLKCKADSSRKVCDLCKDMPNIEIESIRKLVRVARNIDYRWFRDKDMQTPIMVELSEALEPFKHLLEG